MPLLLIFALAVAACGSSTTLAGDPRAPSPPSCSRIATTLQLRPSELESATAAGRCLAQDLHFTGEVQGTATVALAGPAACVAPVRGGQLPPVALIVALDQQPYTLAIQYSSGSDHRDLYNLSPLTINLAVAPAASEFATTLFTVGLTPADGSDHRPLAGGADWTATSGTLTYASPPVSGTLDVTLLRDAPGAAPVRVQGTWRCGVPRAVPSPDPAVSGTPCADIFTLESVAPADAAAILSAGGCSTEDLTFSGDVKGRATDGYNDPHRVHSFGDSDDDTCSASANLRNVRVAVGSEPFLLRLDAGSGPSRGTIPAQVTNGGSAPTATLALDYRFGSLPSGSAPVTEVLWNAIAGSYYVNGGGNSGTANLTFAGGVGGDGTVRLTGSWRCATSAT